MVGIILASHGEFAAGIRQSAQMIFGEQENLEVVTFMPNEGPEDLHQHLEQAIDNLGGKTAEVLFLVDLWGGSPFNQANTLLEEMGEHAALISGMNLPLLLEVLGARMAEESAQAVAKSVLHAGREGVKVKPESLEVQEEEKTEAVASTGQKNISLEEGTVLGDGKIEYGLVRIDTRLLHGQVSTGWAKSVNPTRIIVVSDKVSQDTLRKSLIREAGPSGIRVNVIPIDKFVEIDKDPRFGATKALVLFETPQDVLEAANKGVEFDTINVGSMAHSSGKTMLNTTLSVDDDDVQTLKALKEKGIKFDVRKVPSSKPENLEKLLKEKNLSI